jgi:predicted phosphoribosyltransferase
MIFQDRSDAGRQLAQRLAVYQEAHPLIFGLPRGGVVVAFEVALSLNAPLDVVVARKIGAPDQPELGIGAIAPGGVRVLDERTIRLLDIPQVRIDRVIERESLELERRLRLYRGDRPPPGVCGRTVIVVDDGLATGVTARAAVRSLKLGSPHRTVLAAPVCAPESAAGFRSEVDEIVCLGMPFDFRAVGLWYQNFDQTTDDEVLDLLDRARTFGRDSDGSARGNSGHES